MSDAADFTEALVALAEQMGPIIEMAEGQRKALESRGWSPTAAEAYALELLLGMTRAAMTAGTKR